MSDLLAVILAAGQGTRMKSRTPKVLHPLAGKPVIDYVVNAAREAGVHQLVVIIGHEAAQLRSHFAGSEVTLVEQDPQLGTGHALQQVLPLIRKHAGPVLVHYGDMPLLGADELSRLIERQRATKAQLSFLAATVEAPLKFGRVVHQPGGRVKIVEWADATEEERDINEVNAGIYCFDGPWLADKLPHLTLSSKGEYYLTELVERAEHPEVVSATSFGDCLGVDTRARLAEAERIIQDRLRRHWMDMGVTFLDPPTAFIDSRTKLGMDTIVYPNTWIEGSEVGEACKIGPGSFIRESHIGNECVVRYSVIESSIVEDSVEIGPFSHLRPKSHIQRAAKIGNYAEIKNSNIGEETQIHHFSYTGDAEVGQRVNVGAGSVTSNFDTETREKSRTIIGDDAALGVDTILRAPVTIGAGALTANGSIVTRDVPPGQLVLGAPARVIREVRKPRR